MIVFLRIHPRRENMNFLAQEVMRTRWKCPKGGVGGQALGGAGSGLGAFESRLCQSLLLHYEQVGGGLRLPGRPNPM